MCCVMVYKKTPSISDPRQPASVLLAGLLLDVIIQQLGAVLDLDYLACLAEGVCNVCLGAVVQHL